MRNLRLLYLFLLVFVLSCSDDTKKNAVNQVLQFDKTNIDLHVGETSVLRVTNRPEGVLLTSSSSNESVASIEAGANDSEFVVSAQGVGTAILTIDSSISQPQQITVNVSQATVSNGSWQSLLQGLTATKRYSAVSFTISDYGYVGLGTNEVSQYDFGITTSSGNLLEDFWRYDPQSQTWTQLANFPGGARIGAVAFAIGNKAYVGLGKTATDYKNDFWQYDADTDTWTQLQNFPSTPRAKAIGVAIGGKGYVGTGTAGELNQFNDFWQYDPSSDSWTQKSDLPGHARASASMFCVNNKIYAGLGYYGLVSATDPNFIIRNDLKDFWLYDPMDDSWTQKLDLPSTTVTHHITATYEQPGERSYCSSFSLGAFGYVGLGTANQMLPSFAGGTPDLNIFWKYDTTTDAWVVVSDFTDKTSQAFSLVVGNQAYIGGGVQYTYCGNHCGGIGLTSGFYKFIP